MEQNLFVVVVRIDVIILIYDSGRSVGLHIDHNIYPSCSFGNRCQYPASNWPFSGCAVVTFHESPLLTAVFIIFMRFVCSFNL